MADATNDNTINFPAATQAGQDADTIAIYPAITGGVPLWDRAITTNRAALTLGSNYSIAAGDLDIESETGGSSTASGKVAQLEGLLAGTRYIGLIESSSELNGSGYARQSYAFADWTITDSITRANIADDDMLAFRTITERC